MGAHFFGFFPFHSIPQPPQDSMLLGLPSRFHRPTAEEIFSCASRVLGAGWVEEVRVTGFSMLASPPRTLAAQPRTLSSNPAPLWHLPPTRQALWFLRWPGDSPRVPWVVGKPAHLPQEQCLDCSLPARGLVSGVLGCTHCGAACPTPYLS